MPSSKTKISYGDGKRYEFTPGTNGQLIAQNLRPDQPGPMFLERDPSRRAKVIGPTKTDPLGELRMLLASRRR